MRKKVFQKVNLILAMLLIALSIFNCNLYVNAEDEEIVLRFHYHRPDGEYEKWSLWTWADSQNGIDTPFIQGEDEVYLEMKVDSGTRNVGYIVRTQEWEKDIADDRYISLKNVVSGTLDIYLEYDTPEPKIEYSDDTVIGNKFGDEPSLSEKYSSDEFEEKYTYLNDDLGVTYSKDSSSFKVWAPTAEWVKLCLYQSGDVDNSDLLEEIDMEQGDRGVWSVNVEGDIEGTYYTYKVEVDEKEYEACDPYAKAVGVNGDRAMVVDLDATDPEDWDSDYNKNGINDLSSAVIYEISVRDFSADSSSGVSEENRGKYLAFTEHDTKNNYGDTTGIDYIKNLGVNYLQIMPIQDYSYQDEKRNDEYNWGYGTKNFFAPEGSYSSNPYDGHARIKETKEMIKSIHNEGMGVVLDVVYNHVFSASDFCFNKIVPDYFTRIDEDGKYSNGSYCGNDTATERAMVKKYIIDSVLYWAREYHVDGYRFDLAGLIDVETMNEIVAELHTLNPNIIIYGEGWAMPTVSTKEDTLFATQRNSEKTPQVGYFDDSIRNRVKGGSNDSGLGYVTGKGNVEEIKNSLVGDAGWTTNSKQIINYVSCHDDATLWDKLGFVDDGDEEVKIKENNLAASIIYSAPGAVFMQAGEEMLRTKVDENGNIITNSYNVSDFVNSIKWDKLNEKKIKDNVDYYKELIKFRKEYLSSNDELVNITFLDNTPDNIIAYTVPSQEEVLIIYNPNKTKEEVVLPEGTWKIYGGKKVTGKLLVDPISSYRLILQNESKGQTNSNSVDEVDSKENIVKTVVSTIVSAVKEQASDSENIAVIENEPASAASNNSPKKISDNQSNNENEDKEGKIEDGTSQQEEIIASTKVIEDEVDNKTALAHPEVQEESGISNMFIVVIALGIIICACPALVLTLKKKTKN